MPLVPGFLQTFLAADAADELPAVAPGRAPADPVCLEDSDLVAAFRQVQGRGNAGETGADDAHVAAACAPQRRVGGGYIRRCRVIGLAVGLGEAGHNARCRLWRPVVSLDSRFRGNDGYCRDGKYCRDGTRRLRCHAGLDPASSEIKCRLRRPVVSLDSRFRGNDGYCRDGKYCRDGTCRPRCHAGLDPASSEIKCRLRRLIIKA